ncbi:MAG: YhdH/YhfP family quinone oxidoreductase [Pseudomonadota bacterium]|nr:oxidoreductase [Pseudomonadales bacterium]MDY6919919.1 YhdH/YhfP family quinone oxidoreductase [Pseudomonadota bacterium]
MTDPFRAFQVTAHQGEYLYQVVEQSLDDLPPGDVVIAVEYSSLNYKDALSATGHPGVTRSYPHTPGIDAAGTVVASTHPRLQAGEGVIVTGYDLGMNTPGGFAGRIRVPADWVVHRPTALSAEDAMVFGTAGFTAAMCVDTLLQVGIAPDQGPVLVTGATGGVGMIALWLLNNLGFQVVAATGKPERSDWLKAIGASEVIDRRLLLEQPQRPIHQPHWAAAVDTLGGDLLGAIIKAVQYGGSVVCCGMVAGTELHTSVLPFILRGINLLGVDSVELPLAVKQDIWNLIAGQWLFADFEQFKTATTRTLTLEDLATAIPELLQGRHCGRYLVQPGAAATATA